MKNQEARKQRAKSRTRREKERKTRAEQEERLRSENVTVESILLNDNDYLAGMEQIKVGMRPKISNLFKCNLEKIKEEKT